MSTFRGLHSWSETGVGTNAGVTVTHQDSNAANVHFVSGIQVSGDAAGVVTIESPSGTVLYKMRYTGAFDRAYSFPPKAIRSLAGNSILVKVSASTSNCEASMQGYTLQ